MLDRLTKLREERADSDKGFTLIELLVVVVIIGILIAIAIPLYLNYTKGANDKSAQSDLRGAISAMEQCNSDNGSYPTAVGTTGAITGCTTVTSAPNSSGTQYTYFPSTASAPTGYIIEAKNTKGSSTIYCYASAAGGSVTKKPTQSLDTAYAASCA